MLQDLRVFYKTEDFDAEPEAYKTRLLLNWRVCNAT
jgi:hypothetical protein